MVVHHRRLREPRWRRSAVVNAVGCVATGIVADRRRRLEVHRGGLDPGGRHPADRAGLPADPPPLRRVHAAVQVEPGYRPPRRTHPVVVLVGRVHQGVLDAVDYARSPAPDRLIAVSVVASAEEQEQLAQALGRVRHPDRAAHDLLAVPRADAPDPRVPRRARRREPRRHHHRRHPRVRDAGGRRSGCTTSRRSRSKARLLYRPNTVVTSVPGARRHARRVGRPADLRPQ